MLIVGLLCAALCLATTLQEAGAQLRAKSEELRKYISDHQAKGPDGNPVKDDKGQILPDFTADEIVEFNKRNDELTEIGKTFDALRAVAEVPAAIERHLKYLNEPALTLPEVAVRQPGHDARARKSLGELVVEHKEFTSRIEAIRAGADAAKQFVIELPAVEMKTLMERATGFDPETTRQDRIVLSAQRPVRVPDLIPTTTTSIDTIRYMEETTFTNNAAPAAEGAAVGEAALAYTERSTPIEKIGTWLPITDEQLADVPQLRDLIDNRLRVMLAMAEENQLVNGSGTTPQLIGLLNKPSIQTQAKGTDTIPDAIYKAFTKVRWTGYAEPSGVILHPNDWQDVRLLKDANGNYIFGSPADAGPERIWGKPVVITNVIAENTGLTADFQLYCQAFERAGVVIESTNTHSDWFPSFKLAIRIAKRGCLVIYRAAAVCTVTGL